jgi:hypothetical protein
MNMQYGHAARTCGIDMDMQFGHTAWRHSMERQEGHFTQDWKQGPVAYHAAWTYSMDMQHGYAA